MNIKHFILIAMAFIISGCSTSYSESMTTNRNFLVVSVYETTPLSVDLLDMDNFNMYYNYPIKTKCRNLFKEGDYILLNETDLSFSGVESKSLTMSKTTEKLCLK